MRDNETRPRLDPEHVAAVQQRVLDWYARHGRDLPWRRTRDPYAVLVSEVMLQQTQVERVIPHWHAWLAQFPTLRDLAVASRAAVIRAWQGLGYNLRAVRLHEIARAVDGELPRSLEGLLALKGIGRYTAGAVACFAYELPVSMVDTNVRRVLARIFGVLQTEYVAEAALPRATPYAWNQALMDLGATICRADAPLCLVCPLFDLCHTRASGIDAAPKPRRQPAFKNSSRYIRGRILDRVRALAEDEFLPLTELDEQLVRRMVDDGLLAYEPQRGVRLP